ncbi:MAG: methionine ABC transporter ATP-binding protein [Pseudoclavibacter sp.]
MAPIVAVEHVTKRFTKHGPVALDDVSLRIEHGQVYSIIGYSGAGKSTVIRLVNGLERPTSGRVVVDGADLSELGTAALRRTRARIGMVFQQFNLFDSRTVADNIAFPLTLVHTPRPQRQQRVRELLDFVGLADKADQYPRQLSGGQKQRVGIARALATKPDILLADEATSALDPETTRDVLDLLRRTNTEFGVTIVLVTHQMSVVQEIADRVAVMERGRVVEEGDVYSIFSEPQAETTRRFLSTVLTDVPSDAQLDDLRRTYGGTLQVVKVRSREDVQRLLGDRAAHFGVRSDIVYGSIGELQQRPFGTVTVRVDGEPAQVAAYLAEFGAPAEREEVAA